MRVRVVRRDGQGPDPYENWEQQALAAREEAHRLASACDFDGARAAANRFVTLALGGAGFVTEWTAVGYDLVGTIEWQRGDRAEARKAWEASLAAFRMVHGDDFPYGAKLMVRIAGTYDAADTQAEKLLLDALALQQRVLAEDDPEIGLTNQALAQFYIARKHYARALPHLQIASASCGRVLGEDSTAFATTLVQLAQVYLTRRDFAAAEPLYVRARAILHNAVGEDDLNYTVCLNNLAMLYHIQGDPARAEPLLLQVVEVRRRVAGERHPLYLHALQDLAEFYRSCNDLTRAEEWQRLADEVEKKVRA